MLKNIPNILLTAVLLASCAPPSSVKIAMETVSPSESSDVSITEAVCLEPTSPITRELEFLNTHPEPDGTTASMLRFAYCYLEFWESEANLAI